MDIAGGNTCMGSTARRMVNVAIQRPWINRWTSLEIRFA